MVKHQREPLDWVVVLCAAAMVLTLVGGVLAILWDNQRRVERDQACAAQGWEHADARGGLCVDDDGVVRQP